MYYSEGGKTSYKLHFSQSFIHTIIFACQVFKRPSISQRIPRNILLHIIRFPRQVADDCDFLHKIWEQEIPKQTKHNVFSCESSPLVSRSVSFYKGKRYLCKNNFFVNTAEMFYTTTQGLKNLRGHTWRKS